MKMNKKLLRIGILMVMLLVCGSYVYADDYIAHQIFEGSKAWAPEKGETAAWPRGGRFVRAGDSYELVRSKADGKVDVVSKGWKYDTKTNTLTHTITGGKYQPTGYGQRVGGKLTYPRIMTNIQVGTKVDLKDYEYEIPGTWKTEQEGDVHIVTTDDGRYRFRIGADGEVKAVLERNSRGTYVSTDSMAAPFGMLTDASKAAIAAGTPVVAAPAAPAVPAALTPFGTLNGKNVYLNEDDDIVDGKGNVISENLGNIKLNKVPDSDAEMRAEEALANEGVDIKDLSRATAPDAAAKATGDAIPPREKKEEAVPTKGIEAVPTRGPEQIWPDPDNLNYGGDKPLPIPGEIKKRLYEADGKTVKDGVTIDVKKREIDMPDGKVLTWSDDGKKWKIKDKDGKTVEEYRYHSPKNRMHWDSNEGTSKVIINGKEEDMNSQFAKGAKFDKEGKLKIDGDVVVTGDKKPEKGQVLLSADGSTLTKADESKIIALDKGTMEVDKDGQNIVIKIEGKEQKMSATQYEKLTGKKVNTEKLKEVAAEANNLGIVIDALGREGFRIEDIVDRSVSDPDKKEYWSGKMKISLDTKKKTVKITTCAEGIDPKTGKPVNDDNKDEITKTLVTKDGVTTAVVTDVWIARPEEVPHWVKWKLDGTMQLTVDGTWTDFKRHEDKATGWTFYQYGDAGVYYNYEYGEWYAKNEKGEYRRATEVDLNKAGLGEGKAEELENEIMKGHDKKDKHEGKATMSARKVQRFFNTLETAASGGLGRFFSLFMEDEALEEWREKVDDLLCKTVIGGGTTCWTSKICSKWVDNRPNGGIMYAETPSGMLDIAVHVEAHKDPIIYPGEGGETAREYLYKVTYVVKNTEKEPLGFNVIFSGERTAALYSTNVIVQPGGQSSRLGASAMLQYSNYDYDRVCIRTTKGIRAEAAEKKLAAGNRLKSTAKAAATKVAAKLTESADNEVCNKINMGMAVKIRAKREAITTGAKPTEQAVEVGI